MLCVGDEAVFLPSTIDSLLVPLENKKMIISVLDLIQSSFQTNHCKDSNKLFAAMSGAYLLGKGNGGKMVIFNSSIGMTLLPKMKSNLVVNIPKDELAYTATDEKQLSSMGINMTNENISCDIFAATESHLVKYIL
jgi:hypothetical protein